MADTQTETPNKAKLPAQSGQELGVSGTLMYKGYITSEEYNFDLTGIRGLQIYDTMRRSDPTVHAVLTVVKNPIIGADHDIEKGGDTPLDEEIQRFIKRELMQRNVDWPDVTRQGLTALDFGHSVFEKVLELTDFEGKPRIGLKKLATRKQRSIQAWEMRNGQPGIQQLNQSANKNAPGTIDIPREKLIYVTNEKEGDNHLGISLLRFCYKPWKLKDALEIMNAIALERMGIGVPKLKKDGTVSNVPEPEIAKARESLRQMRANEEAYIELPEGLDVEMMNMGANTVKDILPTIEHQNTQITLSVLAQFLMLGSGKSSGGSRAVSKDHSDLFNKALEAVGRMWQHAIQNDLIKQLVDLNYTGVTNYPKYVINGVADDDVSVISDAVATLMNAGGITADKDVENRLRKLVGLPALSKDDYDNYDDFHKAPDPAADPNNPIDPNNPDNKNGKGNVKKPTDTPKDSKTATPDLEKDAKKKTTASVIADARESKRKLISELVEV